MRLFVALDLPDALRARLAAMATAIPGARWVPAENHHLTLRFIGEVAPDQAEEIDHALAALRGRAFLLTLAGVGTFRKAGRDTQLWVGAARSEPLERLQAKIETALQRAGLPAERRRFQPHVTLARLGDAPEGKLAGFVQTHNLFRAEPMTVEHFTLFSSRLGKTQAVYTPEVDYPLEPMALRD